MTRTAIAPSALPYTSRKTSATRNMRWLIVLLMAGACATAPQTELSPSQCPLSAAVEEGASLPSVVTRVKLDPATVRGLNGFACARVTIGVDGRVREAEILTTSNQLLAIEFLRVLRLWTFQPAMKNGSALESSMTLSVTAR